MTKARVWNNPVFSLLDNMSLKLWGITMLFFGYEILVITCCLNFSGFNICSKPLQISN